MNSSLWKYMHASFFCKIIHVIRLSRKWKIEISSTLNFFSVQWEFTWNRWYEWLAATTMLTNTHSFLIFNTQKSNEIDFISINQNAFIYKTNADWQALVSSNKYTLHRGMKSGVASDVRQSIFSGFFFVEKQTNQQFCLE